MDKSAAPATPPPASAAAPAKPMSRTEEILRRFDKNGDGKLDDDEKADAHEAMLQEQMAKGVNPAVNRGLDAYQALALELFDRNHDGRVDDDERRDAFSFVQIRTDPSIRESILKRFDKNKDGLLDDAEGRESQAYLEEHRGELMQEILLKRYDKNANGQLDPEEKTTIREAFSKFKPDDSPAGAPEDGERSAAQKFLQGEGRDLLRAELIKRFDANGNGQLDPDEQRAAQDYGREHRGEIFRAIMLRRFDKNGDGQLDDSERAAMREALERASANPEVAPEEKKLDPAQAAALAAEVERRRTLRESRASAAPTPPAGEDKKPPSP